MISEIHIRLLNKGFFLLGEVVIFILLYIYLKMFSLGKHLRIFSWTYFNILLNQTFHIHGYMVKRPSNNQPFDCTTFVWRSCLYMVITCAFYVAEAFRQRADYLKMFTMYLPDPTYIQIWAALGSCRRRLFQPQVRGCHESLLWHFCS